MATENGRIYITISDKRNGGGGGDGDDEKEKKHKKSDEEVLADYIKHSFFSMIKSQAKQMVNYTVSNIGNFTGDYQAQREIQASMQSLNVGVSLATAFLGGTIATGGNPIGGVVATVITATAQAVNFGLQEHTNRVVTRNQNYNISQLREISGLDALTNGGR